MILHRAASPNPFFQPRDSSTMSVEVNFHWGFSWTAPNNESLLLFLSPYTRYTKRRYPIRPTWVGAPSKRKKEKGGIVYYRRRGLYIYLYRVKAYTHLVLVVTRKETRQEKIETLFLFFFFL
jgi:hypothetical protein